MLTEFIRKECIPDISRKSCAYRDLWSESCCYDGIYHLCKNGSMRGRKHFLFFLTSSPLQNTKTDDIIDKEIDYSIVKSMNIAIVKEGDAYVIF